jgi:uncharacterized protein (DUF362 family)
MIASALVVDLSRHRPYQPKTCRDYFLSSRLNPAKVKTNIFQNNQKFNEIALMSTVSNGEVFVTKTSDRNKGVKSLLSRYNLGEFTGKHVALKANFNSADPFPASTHIDTLQSIVEVIQGAGAADVTLGERSGMGNTRAVLEQMGVFDLSRKMGFDVIVLDELGKEDWKKIDRAGTHWLHGFCIAKLFINAEKVVQTCCLKAHRFGGHFTLSLKNSVGLVAKKVPGSYYDYMWELHGSPYQRQLIAEINKHYNADLVVMDGIESFVDGGPDRGKEVEPGLLLASKDRVAIDAVGVAILRCYESTSHIMKGRIFELDQLHRASELKLGVKSASEIRLTPINDESREICNQIVGILEREG